MRHGAVLKARRVAAPAVENIVVVPDHQRRNAGEQRGGRRLTGEIEVAAEEVAANRLFHRRGPGHFALAVHRQFLPPHHVGMGLNGFIGVELVAAMQEKTESTPAVLFEKPAPHDVAILVRAVLVAVFLAVAGHEADADIAREIGGNLPFAPVDGIARAGFCRQRDFAAPDIMAEQRDDMGHLACVAALALQNRGRRARLGDDGRAHSARRIVGASRVEDRAGNDRGLGIGCGQEGSGPRCGHKAPALIPHGGRRRSSPSC